jgi:phosphinothricin acetyltransferase
LLKQQGFYTAYAGIALPNEKSVGLHEKFGFKKIGEYNQVGYKLNKWWNVGWWELELNNKDTTPKSPVGIKELNITVR